MSLMQLHEKRKHAVRTPVPSLVVIMLKGQAVRANDTKIPLRGRAGLRPSANIHLANGTCHCGMAKVGTCSACCWKKFIIKCVHESKTGGVSGVHGGLFHPQSYPLKQHKASSCHRAPSDHRMLCWPLALCISFPGLESAVEGRSTRQRKLRSLK